MSSTTIKRRTGDEVQAVIAPLLREAGFWITARDQVYVAWFYDVKDDAGEDYWFSLSRTNEISSDDELVRAITLLISKLKIYQAARRERKKNIVEA